jgi:DNA replication protein DnaC
MSKARHRMTEEAATAAVESACRMLRLPTIRTRFDEIASTAQREQMGYLAFLAELLLAECEDRDRRRSTRRVKAVAIASNEPFSGWTKTFTDPRLCAAIVERLTFGGTSSRRGPTPTASPIPAPSVPRPGVDQGTASRD